MVTFDFPGLTNAQNDNVGHEFRKWAASVKDGKTTKSEAIYFFQKWATENFESKDCCEICTNTTDLFQDIPVQVQEKRTAFTFDKESCYTQTLTGHDGEFTYLNVYVVSKETEDPYLISSVEYSKETGLRLYTYPDLNEDEWTERYQIDLGLMTDTINQDKSSQL